MKSTPHIEVNQENVIAKVVLMPGDPYRAKFLAEKYLENPVCFNHIRGMLGFTGTYKGKKISIMGSGMGMPSIGIYSYELFTNYDVDVIIRIGSAGAYSADLNLFDVVVVSEAYSESSYALAQGGETKDTLAGSPRVNQVIEQAATQLNIPYQKCKIHSSDVFYRQNNCRDEMFNRGCACVEMESFALFHNANVTGKEAACILTISDSLVKAEATTAEQRQTSFLNMAEIALETAVLLQK